MSQVAIATSTGKRGYGISSMRLDKADGRVFVYVSLPFVPYRRVLDRLKVRRAIAAHLLAVSDNADAVFVETPTHPLRRFGVGDRRQL